MAPAPYLNSSLQPTASNMSTRETRDAIKWAQDVPSILSEDRVNAFKKSFPSVTTSRDKCIDEMIAAFKKLEVEFVKAARLYGGLRVQSAQARYNEFQEQLQMAECLAKSRAEHAANHIADLIRLKANDSLNTEQIVQQSQSKRVGRSNMLKYGLQLMNAGEDVYQKLVKKGFSVAVPLQMSPSGSPGGPASLKWISALSDAQEGFLIAAFLKVSASRDNPSSTTAAPAVQANATQVTANAPPAKRKKSMSPGPSRPAPINRNAPVVPASLPTWLAPEQTQVQGQKSLAVEGTVPPETLSRYAEEWRHRLLAAKDYFSGAADRQANPDLSNLFGSLAATSKDLFDRAQALVTNLKSIRKMKFMSSLTTSQKAAFPASVAEYQDLVEQCEILRNEFIAAQGKVRAVRNSPLP